LSIVRVEKDYDALSLVLVAEFDAPIERVWQLWADPRQLERWWGPPSHPATVEKHDLSVGGEVTYFLTGPRGERSGGWWRVTAVDPPTSLEFTDGWANRDGRVRHLPAIGRPDGRAARAHPTGQPRPGGSLVRKIKSHFFISLDGVVEAPDTWHFAYFDDEMGEAVSAAYATTGALLMGRVLYDEWAAYWPEHADQPFGDVMNSLKKYVVSSSLQTAEWQNTEIISGDVAEQVADIKAQDGGDISMSGSATTARWLLREGLLDELKLLVHPIAVGGGLARLFPPDEPSIPLELLSSETFKSGVLNLSYGPAKT
jgi:uncharacterized protein YndB with AHSA1/START domain